MTPEWVDYVGAFSAAAAAVFAIAALFFAIKAGRDLVHDRRDTFEIGILREMLAYLDMPDEATAQPSWLNQFSTLADLIGEEMQAVDELASLGPVLGLLAGQDKDVLRRARVSIYAAISVRVGRSRHSGVARGLRAWAARD